MTGYGRSEETVGDKTFLVEVKSLNGKQFDLRLQLPALLKPYEFEIRNILNEGLERGSVECIISIKQNGTAKPVTVNTDLLKAYYQSVAQVATELKADVDQLLAAVLRLVNIEAHQKTITTLEPRRREKIKENLVKLLEENVGKENYDANRMEQELIFYIEKIDISEEQVRLKNHCDYFRSILEEKGKSKGKKLSFILQEFGREINTTGSKANDSEIQKCVVLMKDELEKAKEQILNVL